MAGNTMTLEFAGDADKLKKASKEAVTATDDVAAAAKGVSTEFDKSGQGSGKFLDKLDKLGSGVSGVTDAFGAASEAMGALVDIQNAGYEKAQRLARASFDVADAQQAMRQATRDAAAAQNDAARGQLDMETALLDQADAQKEYNKQVKAHGKDSSEAKRALVDVKAAGLDYKEAQEDVNQAHEDGKRATLDNTEAQLNLNDAQKEANPTDLQKSLEQAQMYAPLLSGLAGVMGLVTLAQWAWNAAQLASPTTWIILAVLALVAVIVLIATKTTWFQDLWNAAWGGIKAAAKAVGDWFAGPFKDAMVGAWNWIKNAASNTWNFLAKIPGWLGTAFKAIANVLTWPFRTAFNAIANLWNSTVGKLHWSVPGWVPGIGGNSIGVPNIPTFHAGGEVPAVPGGQLMALLQSGETVSRGGDGVMAHFTVNIDRDTLLDVIAKGKRGGGPSFA